MSMPKMRNVLIVLVSLLTLIGCTSPITKTLRQEAAPGVTLPKVLNTPEAYRGDTVIWGGYIIHTVNSHQGSQIFILQTLLGSRDKPEATETSEGRFIANSARFLDPLVYGKGRPVTVAGTVTGVKSVTNKKTGTTYAYPVVQVKQLYLWEQTNASSPYGEPYWWYDPYWDGYWDFPYPYEGGEERFEGEEEHGRGGEGLEMEERGEGRGEGGGYHERR